MHHANLVISPQEGEATLNAMFEAGVSMFVYKTKA